MTLNEAKTILAIKFYGTETGLEINRILNQVDVWHTGTPTEDDWYLVLWRDTDDDWIRFSALLWNNFNKTWYDDVSPSCNWGDEYHAEVIAWQKIEPFEEAST